MISINYYLKDIPSEKNIQELLKANKSETNKLLDKSRHILMIINKPGNRKKIYTNRKASIRQWNKNKQEVNCRKMHIGGVEINKILINFKKEVTQYCLKVENQGSEIEENKIADILKEMSSKGVQEADILGHFNSCLYSLVI